MSDARSKIESLLFISNRPLSVKELAAMARTGKDEAKEAIGELEEEYAKGRGVRIMRHGGKVRLSTSPENAEIVQEFLKDETTGELTKPSLETLTIVAYRGPITKAELEQVRGVNCSLILRNLMIKGLVETVEQKKGGEAMYAVTFDFLRCLGVGKASELPDYEKLSQAQVMDDLLGGKKGEGDSGNTEDEEGVATEEANPLTGTLEFQEEADTGEGAGSRKK